MPTLGEFFVENDVALRNGTYVFVNKRKRSRKLLPKFPVANTPHIIDGVYLVCLILNRNGISILDLDYPVLVKLIQYYTGCGRSWSYRVASCIYYLMDMIR